jgi:tetratricopeptide (TPR) repeat protein
LHKGIDYFNQAIKMDPDYALAYTGLADCYYRLSNIHVPPSSAIPKAKAAVMKAVKRDPALAESHALLGLIRTFYDQNWRVAENEFKTALELAPHSALSYKRYGWALGMLGRFDEAIVQINRAVDLELRSSDVRVGLGIVLHLARQYDAAIVQAQLALDLEPEFFPAHVLLGIAHIQQNRLAEAVAELQTSVALSVVPWTLGYLGYAYGVSGREQQALKVLTELEKRSKRAYVSPYAMALVHTGLGHKEEALHSLARTFEDRNEMLGFVKTSPELDPLRSEERFDALLQGSKLTATTA